MGCLTKDLELKSAEADFGEGPVTIYYRRMNLLEIDVIEKARPKGSVEVVFVTLVTRAREDNGLKMFDIKKDRQKILSQFDPGEVARVIQLFKESDAEEMAEAGNS